MKKSKGLSERDVLELLKAVLPKTTNDVDLASRIINAMEKELQRKNVHAAFEKFCEKCELPSMEATSVMEVKQQLVDAFGKEAVKVTQDKKEEALHVELETPEGVLKGLIKMGQNGADGESDEQEVTLKFVAFPVALPSDPELVWMMAKRENLNAQEAAVTLAKIEEEFWGSKAGQKLLRDRVERTFAEFVTRVPAKMLSEGGLKRHYKEPEAVKLFKTLNK
jgi:hypothetical protein